MRLCFVCSDYPPNAGGIGVFTQTLGRALVRRGHEVRVVDVSRDPGRLWLREYDDVCVWRLREPRIKGGWIAARAAMFARIRGWVRRGEVDLIEVPDHGGWAARWPRLSAPVVVRLHGSSTYFATEMGRALISEQMRRVEGPSLRRADAYCAVSRYVASRTEEIFGIPHDAEIIHNAVELAPPVDFEERERFMVVFTGRIKEQKGVEPLLAAWPRVKARFPQAELHMYGKAGELIERDTAPEGMGRRLGVPDGSGVVFHGGVPRTDVLEALRRARVGVFPSLVEAFALAPLESMAAGCPTIHTRTAAGPEAINDGEDGLLVDPRDPEAIASAISVVLSDDSLARKLGERGRDTISARFGFDDWVSANEAFYARAIGDYRSRARRS